MDFGIIAKLDTSSIKIAENLLPLLRGNNLYLEKNLKDFLKDGKSLEEADKLDYIIWIGGDGTLLKYVNIISRFKEAKLLGIKTGGIGFLCEISPKEIEDSLRLLFAKKYLVEERKLLEVRFQGILKYALNDVLFFVSIPGKTSLFSVSKDDLEIFKGKCDGILVSTSLGSTAYLASTGGPIIDPSLDLVVVNPMNPLKWGSRAFVLPFHSKLRIYSEQDFKLVIDGNLVYDLKVNEKVDLKGSEEKLHFVRFKESFYEKVKTRMIENV